MEPSLANEFPHDNPALGNGSTWICASPRGRALAVRRALVRVTHCLVMPEGAMPPPGIEESLAGDASGVQELVPEALPEVAPTVVPAAVLEMPAVPVDDFTTFMKALIDACLASGALRAAAVLPGLLEHGELAIETLPEDVLSALRKSGVVSKGGRRVSERFAATAQAWRDVLRGTSSDLSACGESTLDGWASELVCAFAAQPSTRAGDYRRELRRRGVAAFGLVAQAA